ncbi:uncharacterized protein [Arachis hypogaea]|uniref:uncharacterized protein n=1 Tax=Arachis hypogaea TaxID=3818 RepID=UPI003B20BB1B
MREFSHSCLFIESVWQTLSILCGPVPKLDGKLDYSYWETLMSTHLKAQNLRNFIEPGLQEGADAAQQRRDQLALSQIHQGVDYTMFGKIANAKSAKEAWNTLNLSYKGVDKAQKAKLQSLRREYERYEMSSSEIVEQYFTRITDLVNKMRVYEEDMPDSKVVEKIFRTMPMKYGHVMTTILEFHDMDTMTIAELQGAMESHISRILEKSEKSTEEALKSRVNLNNFAASSHTQEGRGRGFNFQSRGRGSFRGRSRGNYNQGSYNNFTPPNQGRGGTNFRFVNRGRGRGNFYQERTNFNCFHCGKYGHKAADCRFKMVKNNQVHVAENQHQNADDNPDDSVKLLLKFGNSTKIPIEGKGHIPIRLKDGSLSYISDVFYALELDYNLLSMGQLSEKGYKMITYRGYCTVFDNNGRFIDKAKMTSNRMFPLKIQHVNPSCMSSVILDDNWLWHMRFGYFYFSGLNYLSRKGLISGLPRIHISNCVCEICQLEKKHRDPFPTGKSWRARRLLEIMHLDLCSVEVPSNGGSRCPTKSIRDKTPEEVWSEKWPSIHHFRVFGCIAYAHVPDQLRKKLDDKGEKCIFIGYSTDSKAYKLYNLETKKVIISRDMTFDEKDIWD